jgi:hypothetical protein
MVGLKERLRLLREKEKEAEGEIPESKGELVVVKDGRAVGSSVGLAAGFEKGHKDVLEKIAPAEF